MRLRLCAANSQTRYVCNATQPVTSVRSRVMQPAEIFVDSDSKLTLHGLHQYYVELEPKQKNRKLTDLLDTIDFNQVVIFVSEVQRARELDRLLKECNFPSTSITGALQQQERYEKSWRQLSFH